MQSEILSLVNQKNPSLFPPFFAKLFSSISAQASLSLTTTTSSQSQSSSPPIPTSVSEFLNTATAESLGLVTTRHLLTDFVALFTTYCKDYSTSLRKEEEDHVHDQLLAVWLDIVVGVWNRVIHVLSDRGVAFEELVGLLCF